MGTIVLMIGAGLASYAMTRLILSPLVAAIERRARVRFITEARRVIRDIEETTGTKYKTRRQLNQDAADARRIACELFYQR